jgi:BolA protein
MSTQTRIESKLLHELDPRHLEVVNESGRHNVPVGSETHFKVVVASRRFEGMRRLARHRLVNRILGEELAGGVHALALHTLTPEEWQSAAGRAPESPQCAGGDGSLPGREN